MALNAVEASGLFTESSSTAKIDAAIEITDRQYDLPTALRIVRALETTSGRAAVYEEIKNKNAVYRAVDALYESADKRILQPFFLFLYMVKCAVSIGPVEDREAELEAVALHNFSNEEKTIDRVAALVPDLRLLRLAIERRHVLHFRQLTIALKMIGASARIWPFLQILARRHSFMPSARIASALAYYIWFSWLFENRQELKAAIIASNYSPEAVGMAAAAHRTDRQVVYSNHATVPANGTVVPPVYADCALFYGDKTTQTYRRRSSCTAEIALIGQPGEAHPMQWREEVETIGIFLTSGTKIDVLKSLIATIRIDLPDARILIRQHPVTLLKTDFSGLALDDDRVELTIGNPLDEEIAACDLVICGNSGVAMNVLCGGRPVAYLSSLDGIKFDANGFVESRLVYSMPWWSDDIYSRVKAFYNLPGWVQVMQSYDASYGADLAELKAQAAAVLLRNVRPQHGEARGATGTSSVKLVA
ncbi:hypothetical protein [Erythrobacter rubeus]|uniref:Capsule polysaccharide biosynthesis protein n=1 Tax=Erythrobacter rubeus TaxID=2760803 RepID=A0ABR8KWF7_9SPHN|nr:hypothetical protein [Erythrobacter rubeus]MBD2842461.1 hypothetical protein [Erythrobacter rubeus]